MSRRNARSKFEVEKQTTLDNKNRKFYKARRRFVYVTKLFKSDSSRTKTLICYSDTLIKCPKGSQEKDDLKDFLTKIYPKYKTNKRGMELVCVYDSFKPVGQKRVKFT